MYSQLDKVFLFGMSSPHIIEIDYVVRPSKLVLLPTTLKKDQEEEEAKAMEQQSKVLHEGKDDNFNLPTSTSPSSSSSSSSSQNDHDHGHETKMTREDEVLCKKNTVNTDDDDDDDDDDGYHTPTSPRHRIPAVLECPPAPRKHRQQQRRKRGRAVCRCLMAEFDGDDEMLAAKAKKARE